MKRKVTTGKWQAAFLIMQKGQHPKENNKGTEIGHPGKVNKMFRKVFSQKHGSILGLRNGN